MKKLFRSYYPIAVDADLSKFFDAVNHNLLMRCVALRKRLMRDRCCRVNMLLSFMVLRPPYVYGGRFMQVAIFNIDKGQGAALT
ncbi:hypothetical protein SCARR_01823 [Pontiella sulfatireligans]|uniref:Uncharacterized protein n=2 Tax=Pontiella sulfatireligans TaxID=2750658 RepID=A0A6C2UKC4_9BACT|nr:hypothetical protein SCARR_01823 [Pontiella sulfatireligans]